MPAAPNFYDTLFNHKKIVLKSGGQVPLSQELWDCKAGIFCSSEVVHGSEGEKLVQGILSACNLQPGEWKIFPKGTNYQAAFNLHHLQYILVFGNTEKELNIDIKLPLYQTINFNGKIWVKAHSLEMLSKDAQYKKELWNKALKPLFAGN